MNISYESMSAELGTPPGWDFGDCAYGLEPLLLPEPLGPGDDAPPPRAPSELDVAQLCPSLLAGAATDGAAALAPAQGPAGAQVYWFRWITGHQVSFLLWRLLGQQVRVASGSVGERRTDALAAMTAYVRGYCAMLLYTSSCPRGVYEGLIRPSMFLQHPAFSGTWAPDFGAVRPLLRGRGAARWADNPVGAQLRQAVAVHHTIHSGVAARLVPGGRSLLQEATRTAEVRGPQMLGTLYDNYFLTVRLPQSQPEIVAQLLRRLEAVAVDLRANGLHDPADDEDLPAELCENDVVECGRDVLGVLLRLAGYATGLDAEALGVQLESV